MKIVDIDTGLRRQIRSEVRKRGWRSESELVAAACRQFLIGGDDLPEKYRSLNERHRMLIHLFQEIFHDRLYDAVEEIMTNGGGATLLEVVGKLKTDRREKPPPSQSIA